MKKFLLITVIVIVAVILIGGILIYVNKDKLTSFAVEKSVGAIEEMVMPNLPASVSQDSAKAIFSNAVDKLKTGEVKPPELQKVVSLFQSSMSDNKLDSLEVVNLLDGVNQLGGSVAEK
ncbi:MAG: hypothetical protein ACE5IR_01210 [bacterium]